MEHLADLETWTLAGRVGWKLLTYWWPVLLVGVGYAMYENKIVGVK